MYEQDGGRSRWSLLPSDEDSEPMLPRLHGEEAMRPRRRRRGCFNKKLVPYDGGEAGWESGAWAGPTACQSPATRLDGTAVRKEKIVCGATWLGTVTRSS